VVTAQDLDGLCEGVEIRFSHFAGGRHETLELHSEAKRREALLLEKGHVGFPESEGRGVERRGLGDVAKAVEQDDTASRVGEPAASV